MFIHEPGAECNAQMSCCLRHDLFQGISNRMTKDLKGMIVDNIKPQVDRFVFPDVHRVIVVGSGRLLKPLAIRLSRVTMVQSRDPVPLAGSFRARVCCRLHCWLRSGPVNAEDVIAFINSSE